MHLPKDINEYLRATASELADRILRSFPPLQGVDDPESPLVAQLLRKPFPTQALAIMGVVKRWNQARGAGVIAECGTGKTLISLGAVHVHSERKPFTALAMVPPQLVEKWAREALLTLPRVRVFFIDGLRNPTSSTAHAGVNEVRLRGGRIVREGLRTTLTELRLRRAYRNARARWESICGLPALFIVGRDRGKLSYFWRHAHAVARCGRYQGSVINADSGAPVYLGEDGERLLEDDFKKAKLSEMVGGTSEQNGKSRRSLYSALWQADGSKVRRFAPVDFIGRYMADFFDYAIADEVHELKGDTAQGNALGTLAACAQQSVVLTGTLLGERFLIAETQDLSQEYIYAKERCLAEEVKAELRRGRRCQIYAVYTQKRDVTRRLERILGREGIRVAVLTTDVPPEKREAWYERQLRAGVQAVICHPKLVQTGLDLIEFPTILFYETGYSVYVLRQASRRSWRIGQRLPVKVKFLHYRDAMQETCLRLMGKKLLVSLAMEGKFTSEGLQSINDEDDILMAMARELVTEKGIGEKADEVWSAIQKRQEAALGVQVTSESEPAGEPELVTSDGLPAEPVPTQLDPWAAIRSGMNGAHNKTSRRSNSTQQSDQLALF